MTLTTPDKSLAPNATISIIDAGFGGAQRRPGVETAPARLIESGLESLVLNAGRSLAAPKEPVSYESLMPSADASHRGMNNPRWVSAVTYSISDQVYQQMMMERHVLTLGGDHSIAIGTLTGSAKAIRERFGPDTKLGIVYVDAHADLNVPEDSASGNIHGMAVAFASGLAKSTDSGIFDWISDSHLIDPGRLVYIGLRDVDEAEKRNILDRFILAFWMEDVREIGVKEIMRRTLKYLGNVPIHVSFDMDGLDPTFAPSTGLPVPGGLTLDEAITIMESISRSERMVAMDIVEINPTVGGNDDVRRTLMSALEVIKAGIS